MRFQPGSRDAKLEGELADSLIVSAEREPLAGLIADLKDASRPAEFYALQQLLLKRFYARQKVTDELVGDLSATKSALARVTAQRPIDREAVIPLQRRLAQEEFAQRCCKAVLHALRCVGDGIAWKALRYDRAAITVLGAGARVGRLADAAGLDAELAMAATWWEEGKFAIHNDLTNCLRTGDLTLPFEPNNTVGVQEVKAGTSQRAAQSRAIERKLRFLADGEGTEVFDGDHSRLVRYPIAMRTHLAALTEVVTRARDDGYASAHPSPSLLVIAVDPRVSRGDPGIEAFDEQVRAEAGWKDEPRIIRMLSIVRRMRERLHHFPYLAPLTIFPLRAADIAELILGPLEFMVTLNAPVLEAQFEAAGISAEVITNQPGSYSTFLKASRGDAQVELSALIGEQMLGELLEPQMLIEGVDFMLSEIERGHEGKALVGFADEAATWAGT